MIHHIGSSVRTSAPLHTPGHPRCAVVCSLTLCSSPCSFPCLSYPLLFSPEPLPPCRRRQGNYPLALRQMRSLAPWPNSPPLTDLEPSRHRVTDGCHDGFAYSSEDIDAQFFPFDDAVVLTTHSFVHKCGTRRVGVMAIICDQASSGCLHHHEMLFVSFAIPRNMAQQAACASLSQSNTDCWLFGVRCCISPPSSSLIGVYCDTSPTGKASLRLPTKMFSNVTDFTESARCVA